MSAALTDRTLTLRDGHRVGVTTGGSGTPLVFFHGFTANRRLYAPILALLAARGFSVVALDMAGHGDTDGLLRGHTFADMRDLAVRALDELGIGSAVMVGHSLGGRMVAEVAAAHPERVRHAVLINAAVGDYFDGLGLKVDVAARLPFGLAGAVVDLLGDVPWSRPRKAVRYLRHLAAFKPSLSGVFNVAMATHSPSPKTVDLLAVLRDKAVPVSVIHSVWDLIVPFANGLQASRVSGGALVVLPGFHNWVMVHPQRCADEIIDAVQPQTGVAA
ncbi:hydrolase [Mycobacterium phage Marshawn]|uniref:Hydrolase n=1 Tax=Mycobacterium phage Marshawn TaxID=2652423 RepID=A0A5P8D737_9CAUD|nr:esterase/lipase [Mycobacterium phage Marshawn]QFP94845.1 hydrolase [Mycobacterium phage Marshawn]